MLFFLSGVSHLCPSKILKKPVLCRSCHLGRHRRHLAVSAAAHKIAVLPGDGIGPEIARVAVDLLKATGERLNESFLIEEADFGGVAIDTKGNAFPQETLEICQKSDAVLLAAIGGQKWDALPPSERPERGLLNLRAALKTFANLRPAIVFPQVIFEERAQHMVAYSLQMRLH